MIVIMIIITSIVCYYRLLLFYFLYHYDSYMGPSTYTHQATTGRRRSQNTEKQKTNPLSWGVFTDQFIEVWSEFCMGSLNL